MKVILAILLLYTSTNFSQSDSINIGDLTILIVDLSDNEGTVRVALFNSEESYEKGTNPVVGEVLDIKNKISKLTIENLSFGEYAVKCYHDKNNNGELDTNFLGIPQEDYGFSNNADGLFGPPPYNRAKFQFETKLKTISISLK
jgi:uncharacterized protein (DUF2141 family)